MAIEVTLPELGESVTEGTITEWLVSVGDDVNEDDPLFELSSDKIDTEVPSPASGTLKEIKVDVDETVEVGTVVAIIGEPDEEAAASGDEGGGTGDEQGAQTEDAGSEDDDQAQAQQQDEQRQEGGGEEIEVTLPELGESVTEGTITEWLVSVGDDVNEDDPLFELSSDKIDTEVPSPASGTLKEIKVDVDETVEVGTVVAIIGSGDAGGDGGSAAESTGDEQSAETDSVEGPYREGGGDAPSQGQKAPAGDGGAAGNGGVAGGEALMSPIVRRMVAEHDLDADQISGSGRGGRITREDVEAAISGDGGDGDGGAPQEQEQQPAQARTQQEQEPQQAPQPARASEKQPESDGFEPGQRERVEKVTRIRQRIAAKMQESLTSTAQLTTVQEADMTRIMQVRAGVKDEFKQREGASLSPFAFLARAAILAIRRHPTVNAKVDWDAGQILYRDYVNLGIAVDTEKGLLVPNIKNADDLTLGALARNIAEAAQKARGKGQLEMSDIQGGTFTVTNTGSRGVLLDTPILNYPEVAILATGAIQKRPVVVADDLGETIAIRQMVYLCLTYDHQILDGADAARYVSDVAHVVETHDWEAELGIA